MYAEAQIKRILYRIDGTYGVFIWKDFPVCVTLELPWLANRRRVSCIPTGLYHCKRVDSPKFGDTFEITDVPNRDEILFHGANTIADLLGCVGLAEFYHRFNGMAGVANPHKGAAMIEFHQLTSGVNAFKLEIMECFSGK